MNGSYCTQTKGTEFNSITVRGSYRIFISKCTDQLKFSWCGPSWIDFEKEKK